MDLNYDYVKRAETDFLEGFNSLVSRGMGLNDSRLAALEDELVLSIGAAAGFWLESDSSQIGSVYAAHDVKSGFNCTLRVDYAGAGSIAYTARLVSKSPFSRADIVDLIHGTPVYSPNAIGAGILTPQMSHDVVFSAYEGSAADLSLVLAAAHLNSQAAAKLSYLR